MMNHKCIGGESRLQNGTEIEIIDFYRPVGNGKNLFVSNINVDLEEHDAALSFIQGRGSLHDLALLPHAPQRCYYGSEHDKGEADGETGIMSQALRRATYQGHDFSDAKDMVEYLSKHYGTDKRQYVLIEIINRVDFSGDIQTIPGTRKYHQFQALTSYVVQARGLACFCTAFREGERERRLNLDVVGPYVVHKCKPSIETMLNEAFLDPPNPSEMEPSARNVSEIQCAKIGDCIKLTCRINKAQRIFYAVTSLHKAFSRFGLIYEIQVFPILPSKEILKNSEENFKKRSLHSSDPETLQIKKDKAANLKFYAFVKFYSVMCAKRAKSHLNMTSIIGVKPVKITFASRKKSEKREKLFLNNCFDLANFYLGFNGWSTSLLCLKRDATSSSTTEAERQEKSCKFLCIVELTIHNHGLVTQGVSTVEESWDTKDPLSKSSAMIRCHKRCYQYALENAFSKLLLVSLGNGKVHAEIDTTQADPLHRLETLHNLHLVTVSELDEEPDESSEDEENNESLHTNLQQNGLSTIDDENINILMELEKQEYMFKETK